MKKYILIGATTVLLVALGVSAFFYMQTRETPSEVTGNSANGFESDALSNDGSNKDIDVGNPSDAGSAALIRQVATRPVAGAVLFTRDDVPYARYAERGTGYMYEVNLNARTEERISNTTFRQVSEVVFSPQGTRATVEYMGENGRETAFGVIEKGDDGVSKFTGSILPIGTQNTGFNTAGDKLYYTLTTQSGVEGYQRDLKATSTKMIFSLPLRAVTTTWNPSPFIVTTPSYSLFGAAYRANGDRVAYGKGLMALSSTFGTTTLISTVSQNGPESAVIDGVSSQKISTFAFAPKCAFADSESLLCAVPQKSVDLQEFPDSWLMGTLQTNDSFYLIDIAKNSAREIVNPSTVGRVLDVTNVQVVGNTAVFVNRLDESLWVLSF